ncbi:NUDIX hydrolase [Bacillus gobiensis]|uniref:NUDIX hydrolase n=1 Tax=Bacillus gobiensis TaxID=1441095 RepID=UPI003D1BC709
MEEVKVVYALIKNKYNQILMVNNHEGHWSLPGGKVETDETLIEATIREVYEETGFEIEIGNLLAVNEAKFLKRNHHAIFFTFEAQIVGGTEEIKMPQEILQIEWANIEQANKRMPYYTEGIQKLMQGYALYHNQGTI